MAKKKRGAFSCDGMWGTRFYGVYKNMKSRTRGKVKISSDHRCYNGVRLSREWGHFLHFKRDMYSTYLDHVVKFGEKNTSIDRINNKKGYSKENCRWATPSEQTKNRRNVVLYTHDGKTMNLKDWATHLGFRRSTLQNRLTAKWPLCMVLSPQRFGKGRKSRQGAAEVLQRVRVGG